MNILDARILLKRSTTAGVVPTIPASSSHTDGTWINTDVYSGEAFLNTVDERMFVRTGADIKEFAFQNSLIGTYQYSTKTLTSAEILALGTTPITLISAPGIDKAIWVKNVYGRLNFNTTAYSNQTLRIKLNGADTMIGKIDLLLYSSMTRSANFLIKSGDDLSFNNDTIIIENSALQIYTTANPTTGNSTIDILVEYQILDFNSIF